MTLQDILDNFEFIDGWEDRYRYLIELGQLMNDLEGTYKTDAYKVPGCVSQVWIKFTPDLKNPKEPRLHFKGDSDAHIVRGLVALVTSAFSGKTTREIEAFDFFKIINQLDLADHLSPQRSNGLASMIGRIKQEAKNLSP